MKLLAIGFMQMADDCGALERDSSMAKALLIQADEVVTVAVIDKWTECLIRERRLVRALENMLRNPSMGADDRG